MKFEKRERIETDVLIIGGGTAGCYAALTLQKESNAKVLIVEKAAIRRSGCLAAGVNALNAYIVKAVSRKIMWIMPRRTRPALSVTIYCSP